jgi:hypothetical protein
MGGTGGVADAELNLTEELHDKLVMVGGDAYGTGGPVVRSLYLKFSDGQEMNLGWSPTYKLAVPAGHYLSTITVISRFFDRDRGMLHDDLVRVLYFGFKMKPDALVSPKPAGL